MKIKDFLVFFSMFFVSILVFLITGGDNSSNFSIFCTEITILAYMSYLVITPLAKIFGEYDYEKRFWVIFTVVVLLMFIWNYISPIATLFWGIVIVIIGFFIVVPLTSLIYELVNKGKNNEREFLKNHKFDLLICRECGKILNNNSEYCIVCGAKINKDSLTDKDDKYVNNSKWDGVYSLSVKKIMDSYIEKELVKCNFDKNTKLIPATLLRRKKMLNILFLLLIFTYISMIFFHFPLLTYLFGFLILLGFFMITRKYNLVKYLRKQIKIRPNEKISNVVMSTKASLVPDNSLKSLLIVLPIAVILPLIIFYNPRVFYEEIGDGYAVRFYTFGLSNFTTATIKETYNGKPVVSLRGNAFSNMSFLQEVTLPDTITEIRGQAFKNDFSLKKVNIPKNLEYLGGGSFYNCKSITSIILPDTLLYMGGEVFYGAESLEKIKLSEKLYEIRGNSFENCSSLKYIEIPDNIIRIKGHAFDGASSLVTVKFTENSQLEEIGSSAFRNCKNLRIIEVPKKVKIHSRAFKESPTTITFFELQDENFN